MVQPTQPPANAFVAAVRRVYNPIGFGKGYNFVLWFITAGALMGFTLARLMYLDFSGIFCPPGPPTGPRGALPGECYFYQPGRGRVGILLHLGAILPAGFLVVFQFVPAIRHKLLILHRINGYVVILLSLVSIAGVLMIARNSFGGGLDMQIATGVASIVFVSCEAMAYYNIKRLQIEQHRAWMLRAWIIAGFIITMRLIDAIVSAVLSAASANGYYYIRSCAVLDYTFLHNRTQVESYYPDCNRWYSGAEPDLHVLVDAYGGDSRKDHIAAGFGVAFGASGWLALTLHAIGVEIYLRLTPVEGERLRKISYQRQLEAGMRQPGNAGLTVEKLGDAHPWSPPEGDSDMVHEQKTSGSEENVQ